MTGRGRRWVWCGSRTQQRGRADGRRDLPGGSRSGLRVVQGVLEEVDDINFCYLTNHDVVRHKLVGQIVAAYDRFEAGQPAPATRAGR